MTASCQHALLHRVPSRRLRPQLHDSLNAKGGRRLSNYALVVTLNQCIAKLRILQVVTQDVHFCDLIVGQEYFLGISEDDLVSVQPGDVVFRGLLFRQLDALVLGLFPAVAAQGGFDEPGGLSRDAPMDVKPFGSLALSDAESDVFRGEVESGEMLARHHLFLLVWHSLPLTLPRRLSHGVRRPADL